MTDYVLIYLLVAIAVALVALTIYMFKDNKLLMYLILIIFIGVNFLLWTGRLNWLLAWWR